MRQNTNDNAKYKCDENGEKLEAMNESERSYIPHVVGV